MVSTVIFTAAIYSAAPVLATPNDEAIKAGCNNAQTVLNQTEKTDAALRINRGRIYNEVVDLFYAMNARLAANKISAPKLVTITSEYEKELADFRDNYNKYDDQLNSIISLDCKSNPSDFYKSLTELRDKRGKLQNNLNELKKLFTDYQTEFDITRTKINETNTDQQ